MTKEQLQRYQAINLEREQIKKELERVASLLTSTGVPSLDGRQRASGHGDPVADRVVRKQTLLERYAAKLEQLETAQTEIEDAIEALEPIERVLLRHRYIEGMTWEEVCVAVGYSWRQTHRIHAQALKKLK